MMCFMNVNNPIFFSVIIPLYNKAEYILRALKSVLSQSYDNFEIIVVNDGSTDAGAGIVEAIENPKIKLITQKNSGVSVARNKGAENANYNYLAFLDGDDTWDVNFLEQIKNLILEFPDAGIYGTNNRFLYPNGYEFYEKFDELFKGRQSGILEDYFGLFAEIHKSPFSNSNLCIPKKIYEEFGGYKRGVKLTEDSDLWCRIAFQYKIAFTKLPLATYFLALEGSTHSSFENKDFEVTCTLQNALKDEVVKPELIPSVKKLIVFQKLCLIKRGVLTGNKNKVAGKIFNIDIAKHYPKDFLICLTSLIIPDLILQGLRKSKL
jgi:glycosyltransferase involved in cell wall biosynthesis